MKTNQLNSLKLWTENRRVSHKWNCSKALEGIIYDHLPEYLYILDFLVKVMMYI